jgi:hypothetical protein
MIRCVAASCQLTGDRVATQLSDSRTAVVGVEPSLRPVVSSLFVIALAALAVTFAVFVALHVLPPTSEISPVHRTISEYGLTTSAWAFDLGVVSLAVGSVAVLAGLVMVRRIRLLGAGTIFGTLWIAGLLTLVTFPKHNWALGGMTSSGQVHRMASLVAFLALPIAAMAMARRHDQAPGAVAARCAFWLGVVSLLWFSPIVIAVVTTPGAWWLAIPLGLVERGMALTEVAALVALAFLLRSFGPGLSPPGPLAMR